MGQLNNYKHSGNRKKRLVSFGFRYFLPFPGDQSCIKDYVFIDPPYNTNSKDFVYNDSFVDSQDTFRHSKWLSFMNWQSRLTRELLSDDGAIFISIKDRECAGSKLLCDEIFDEACFVAKVTWQSNYFLRNDAIDDITEEGMVFNSNVNNLTEEQRLILEPYLHDS